MLSSISGRRDVCGLLALAVVDDSLHWQPRLPARRRWHVFERQGDGNKTSW
jgi:hypothetical protein